MNPAPPRVFVVDDDHSACSSLANLLRAEGYATQTFHTSAAYLALPPGPTDEVFCLILDLALPRTDGLALQSELLERGRGEQIVFITGHGSIPQGIQAMKAGAVDFLTKPFDDEALLSAIAEALRRSADSLRVGGAKARIQARISTLTPREFQVFRLVIAGLLNKQIANELGAAVQTIKIHRARMMRKLAVVSVADLVRLADSMAISPAQLRQ